MKHLPNLLTLANLFCGCIAIVYILTAQPFLTYNITEGVMVPNWVYGVEQTFLGSIFIGIAAVCDVLDGAAARALKIFSPIGKDLDSLADVVSFGVAPAMILFKLLWDAVMMHDNALDASMLEMTPALLIPYFAALRLAKFNNTNDKQKDYFIGMPTPAVGLFIATLPLISWYNPYNLASYFKYKWGIYAFIAILCWLMVSNIKFFKLKPMQWNLAGLWPHLVIIIATVVAGIFVKLAALPIVFVLYILLSLVYKYPQPAAHKD